METMDLASKLQELNQRSLQTFSLNNSFETEEKEKEQQQQQEADVGNQDKRKEKERKFMFPKGSREEVLSSIFLSLSSSSYSSSPSSSSSSTNLKGVALLEGYQQEIDNILAKECPFCGELMTKSISFPLISQEEESYLFL